jgi:hypothetical protein
MWGLLIAVFWGLLTSDYTNGRSGIFDVKPYLDKGVFTQLQDLSYFKQVKPFFCGIVWPNEQDLSADTLAHELKQVEAA